MLLIEQYNIFLNFCLVIDNELFSRHYSFCIYETAQKNFSRFWYELELKSRLKWLELANLEPELYDEFNKIIRYVYDISAIQFDKLFYDSFYSNNDHMFNIDGIPNKLYWFKHDITRFWNSLNLEEKNKFIGLIDTHEFTIGELCKKYSCFKQFEKIVIYNQRYNQKKVDNLPTNIYELGCSNCKIKNLDNLPARIVSIDCSENCIENLDNLPENLSTLICYSNNIKSLNNLPNKLEHLNAGYNSLSELKNLPNSLKVLIVEHNDLVDITGLPENLEKLDISWNDNIQSFEGLPQNLKVLRCITCEGVVDNLPEKLESLIMTGSHIDSIIKLPLSLKYLDISGTLIEQLNDIPPNLEYLNVAETKITCLDNLPPTLVFLDIQTSSVEKLGILPYGLKELFIGYSKIKNTNLPVTLQRLYFNGIDCFTELPDSIFSIDCDFGDIKNIKYFPNNIYYFGCRKLLNVPLVLPYGVDGQTIRNKFIYANNL